MAEGGGVRQWFRLLFDRRAAEKTKQETQRALNQATDPKKSEANQKRIGKGMERLGAVAKRLGVLIAAAFSIRNLIRFGDELEQSRRTLVRMTGASGAALKNLQGDVRSILREVPDSVDEVSVAVGTLNTLLGLTGPALQRVTRASLDFARMNDVEVASSSELVGQLINRLGLEADDAVPLMDRLTLAGQATGASVVDLANNMLQASPALDSFGFTLNQQVALMSELERRGISASEVTRRLVLSLGRFAEQGASSAGEAWEMLVSSIQEAETEMEAVSIATEAFGSRGSALAIDIRNGVLEIEELTAALSDADGTMQGTEESSRTAGQEIKQLANEFKADLMPAVQGATRAVLGMTNMFRTVYRAVVTGAARVTGGLVLGFQLLQEAAIRSIRWIRRATGRSTEEQDAQLRRVRVQIAATRQAIADLNMSMFDTEEQAQATGDAFDAMRQAAASAAGEAERLSEILENEVALLSQGHNLRQLTGREMLRAVALEQQIRDRLREGNLELEERIALAKQLQAVQAVTQDVTPGQVGPQLGVRGGGGVPEGRRITSPGEELERQARFVDGFADQWQDSNRLILNSAQTAAHGVASAWEDAFAALIMEGEGFQGFMEGLFRGTAAAGLGALAQYASEKVGVNLAEAAEQFARSLGWGFLNPAQAAASQASAKQHLAAAAAWSAIGGAAGASQRAVGGGGRAALSGGLHRGANDPHGRLMERQQGPDIIIQVDGINPRRADHQRLVGETARVYQERFGGRITVQGGRK